MKKLFLILSTALVLLPAFSQSEGKKKKATIAPSYAWTVQQPLGLRDSSTIDTLLYNYYKQSIPSEMSDAWATTGALGAEGINMIFSERRPVSDFFLGDALAVWLPNEKTNRFYNTRIPMTLLSFNTSGGRETSQERLRANFSGNVNAKAQIGAMIDYIYSKGSYNYQATKDLIWGASGSYMGDRYEFQGYFNHFNMLNKENGGITDVLYIKDPAQLQGGVSSINPKSIPTNLTDAHTRYSGDDLMLNSRYKVGYWHEEEINDTTVKRTYIPVSSFIWTLRYKSGKHTFIDKSPSETSEFFENTYLDNRQTRDHTKYWSLSNTLGISMLEGFNKYAKFGLAAYVTHEIRRYTQTPDTLDRDNPDYGLTPFPEGIGTIEPKATQNLLWVGGQLSKQKGSILTYNANAEFGLIGDAVGEVKINGSLATRFKLFGDTVTIAAQGGFHNETAPYLLNNYLSNHFIWKNDFSKIRRVNFGGRLDLPFSGTSLSVDVDNIQNYIYFNENFLPTQHGSNIQVFSARLNQNFRFGILNWNNRITYQTSSNDGVIPLPKLAVYSNLFLLFKVATLHVQVGVDCDYYTSYYGLTYQPATASFATQRNVKVGNYPFMNIYANMKLSKARFFVLFSHFNQGLFGGNNYFAVPDYPLNPRRLQLGVSVDFAN